MLLKWLAVFFQHGLASVAALLVAVATIWWVEPTTTGGITFLFLMVFIVVLAVIELAFRLAHRFRPPPTAEPVDAPTAGTAEPAPEVNRSRES